MQRRATALIAALLFAVTACGARPTISSPASVPAPTSTVFVSTCGCQKMPGFPKDWL